MRGRLISCYDGLQSRSVVHLVLTFADTVDSVRFQHFHHGPADIITNARFYETFRLQKEILFYCPPAKLRPIQRILVLYIRWGHRSTPLASPSPLHLHNSTISHRDSTTAP